MKNLIFLIFIFPVQLICQNFFLTGQSADLMISGVDFNNTGGPLYFNHPSGVSSDGENLIVCDRFNNRVLIWYNAPLKWNALPDVVIGQSNFTENNAGASKSNLNWPGNASAAGGKLAIADTENDRILLWNTLPSKHGTAADIEIKLPSVNSSYRWPWGVWTDGIRLAATATQGGAILFWNKIPVEDNQKPDYTISNEAFGTVRNISSDGASYFFVGDHNSNLTNGSATYFWNRYPTTQNEAFDFYRNEWLKGIKLANGNLIATDFQSRIFTWNGVPKQADQNPVKTLKMPFFKTSDGMDVAIANGNIFINNYNGNNVLVYSNEPDLQNLVPTFTLGVSHYSDNTLDSIGYIQNPCMSSDGSRLIISSDNQKKIYLYDPLPSHSGQLPDQVISTESYDLAPWDNALYNNVFVAGGKQKLCIWNPASNLSTLPTLTFNTSIGSATFTDIHGVALDNSFLYVADRSGKVFIWEGLPATQTVNPFLSLDYGPNAQMNRLSSDGNYLCVTFQANGKQGVDIYKISDLLNKLTQPWKSINSIGLLNQPFDAMVFNGSSLAIANMSNHDVLLWADINDAPNEAKMIILGNDNNMPGNKPSIGKNRLFMPGSLLFVNGHLFVGEHKFSSRILRYTMPVTTENEELFSQPIIAYPVPSTNRVTLKVDQEFVGNQYQMLDAMGRVVGSGTIENMDCTIGIDHLMQGIYFLKVIGTGNSYLKIIKE